MASLLCTLPLIGALLADCAPPPPLATGYVEGEYVLIAPITNVRIDSLSVRRGDRVVKDQQLVTLEKRDAEIALAGADAGLARLESQLADLQQGRRPASRTPSSILKLCRPENGSDASILMLIRTLLATERAPADSATRVDASLRTALAFSISAKL